MDELREVASHDIGWPQAENLLDHRAHVGDHARRAEGEDHFGDLLDQVAVLLLGLAQGLLGRTPLRDIGDHADHMTERAYLGDTDGVVREPPVAPVGDLPAVLDSGFPSGNGVPIQPNRHVAVVGVNTVDPEARLRHEALGRETGEALDARAHPLGVQRSRDIGGVDRHRHGVENRRLAGLTLFELGHHPPALGDLAEHHLDRRLPEVGERPSGHLDVDGASVEP